MRVVPRKLLERRIVLPRLRSRTGREDDPRIFEFNGERDEIVAEVVARVMRHYEESPSALDYILNDTALQESRRLESQRDEEAEEHLERWHKLMRRVSRMADSEKREALREIVSYMAKDVAGNFDPRVYWFAEKVVPNIITGTMRPRALLGSLVNPEQSALNRAIRNEGHIADLHRLARIGTLIVVPTHSSNLDSLAIGEGLQREGLPPCIYGAGKNLFTNPIISFFMHNLGAYRVDRRIRAQVYKQVLKTYSAVMIERGYHSLFFPGGTRDRSGMVERRLKLGLAGTALEAFVRSARMGRPRPVFFVPVTINYGLVLEAETLIEDFLKERGKARYIIDDDEFSRLERWVSFFSSVTNHDAACVLRFGKAIDPFGNPVDDRGRSLAPDGHPIDPVSYVTRNGRPVLDAARDAAYTRQLGELLGEAYGRDTVIMSGQLVGHVLYRRLVESTPGLDLFARMRRRGEVSLMREELLQDLGETRDRLIGLQAQDQIRASRFVRESEPEEILDRALKAWSYHRRPVARDLGAEVIGEDPSMMLYYGNRLAHVAEGIADEGQQPAAREINELWRSS